jgi:hypothetical protein
MTLIVIIGLCVLFLVLGFLLPRLSRYPQRGVDKALGTAERAGHSAPGPFGGLVGRWFGASRRATQESAATGRRGRRKLPL